MLEDLPETDRPRYSSGALLYLFDRDVLGWQRRVEFLRGLPGLGHVEVWIEDPGLSRAEAGALAGLLQGLRVTLSAPHLQLSMISHHEGLRAAAQQVYLRSLALAEGLSAELMTLCGGTRPFFLEEERALDQVTALLAALSASASRTRLALKNVPASSPRTPEYPATLPSLQRCMERIPDLHVTLDVGNCTYGGENWISFLRASAPRIAAVHLHDANKDGERLLRLGSGSVDAFALARLLRAVRFEGFVTLTLPGQRDVSESFRLWRSAQDEAAQEGTASLREHPGAAHALGPNGSNGKPR